MKTIPLALLPLAALLLASCGGGGGHSSDSPSTEFAFATDDPSAYSMVDRMGMPVVNTLLMTCSPNAAGCLKDQFNQTLPEDEGTVPVFVQTELETLKFLHFGLDGTLVSLGLTPCAVTDPAPAIMEDVDIAQCVRQVASAVIPDLLHLDVTQPDGFPNGRQFADPVVDRTLALALLDLRVTGQDVNTIANLPINPPANDKTFPTDFPYLADPFPLCDRDVDTNCAD